MVVVVDVVTVVVWWCGRDGEGGGGASRCSGGGGRGGDSWCYSTSLSFWRGRAAVVAVSRWHLPCVSRHCHLRRSGVDAVPSLSCLHFWCWSSSSSCWRGRAVDNGHHCGSHIIHTGGPSSCWCVCAAVVIVVIIHLNINMEDLPWAL